MELFQKLYIILCRESFLRLFLSERNKELTLLSYQKQLFVRFGSHGKAVIGIKGGGEHNGPRLQENLGGAESPTFQKDVLAAGSTRINLSSAQRKKNISFACNTHNILLEYLAALYRQFFRTLICTGYSVLCRSQWKARV
jgi:hypothetical protein